MDGDDWTSLVGNGATELAEIEERRGRTLATPASTERFANDGDESISLSCVKTYFRADLSPTFELVEAAAGVGEAFDQSIERVDIDKKITTKGSAPTVKRGERVWNDESGICVGKLTVSKEPKATIPVWVRHAQNETPIASWSQTSTKCL